MSEAAIAIDDDADDETGPERRCLVTGVRAPVEGMLRFVVAPDPALGPVPDLACRLPGRGMWLTARRDIVLKAAATNAFARAAKAPVRVDAGLADRVEALLAGRLVDLVAFARRAGAAVGGAEKLREATAAGRVRLRLAAADGRGDAHVDAAVVAVLTREELGRAFGRDELVHAGVLDAGWAGRIAREATRLAGFRGATAGDEMAGNGAAGQATTDSGGRSGPGRDGR